MAADRMWCCVVLEEVKRSKMVVTEAMGGTCKVPASSAGAALASEYLYAGMSTCNCWCSSQLELGATLAVHLALLRFFTWIYL